MILQITDFVTLIGKKLSRWYEAAILTIPNLLLALVVIIFFSFISKYIARIIARIMGKLSHNISLVAMVSTLVRLAIVAVGLFSALSILGLDKTVTSLLAGAGVIALAVGFAFQDLTANFISGTFITLQRPIKVGDVVDTNGYFGKVKSINLRSIIIDNFGGQEIEIPSKEIFQNPITNFSTSGERRMQVDCGVSYSDDLALVQRVAVQAVEALNFVRDDKPVELHFTEFGDSSINFLMWFWIKQDIAGPPLAKSEAIKAIKVAFDAHDISIPFPIRTLEFTPNANSVEVSMLNGMN
ncbi:mechanosensitive ion channel family protein [Arundinibacter roseus]|uniref:Mechanosensitive ion channel family protein n=1 Tax=Arundinibacter roseus TaxID=2070510 RepID=A0A4R4JYU9_9BACT|nr:mechanosensitive ion channel family protein [Arundinibacter roseus]TDB60054.1 mechanosensitive ion channel family protein [Arundinibacter roseus]